HECDVAVLSKAECDRSRSGGVLPRSRALILAIEAKYYASRLPLHLGRGFLGLDREFRGTSVVLATNVASDHVVSLILHHNSEAQDQVLPGTQAHTRLLGIASNRFYKYNH